MSRYVCPVHPEVVVSWKGTGCPECDRDRRRAPRRTDRDQLSARLTERTD